MMSWQEQSSLACLALEDDVWTLCSAGTVCFVCDLICWIAELVEYGIDVYLNIDTVSRIKGSRHF